MSTWNIGDYTLADQDSYFSKRSHVEYLLYTSFDEAQRESALREAEIIIWQFRRGCSLTAVADYDGTERIRTDYAVYEQALHLLRHNGSNPNGEQSGAKWIEDDSADPVEDETAKYYIAPKALVWLGFAIRNPRIARG